MEILLNHDIVVNNVMHVTEIEPINAISQTMLQQFAGHLQSISTLGGGFIRTENEANGREQIRG